MGAKRQCSQYANSMLLAAVDPSAPCGGCPPNAAYCDGERCVTPLCADVAAHCAANTQTGIRARQLCPNTCGCNDPTSPLALFAGEQGCGDQCRARAKKAHGDFLRRYPGAHTPLLRLHLDRKASPFEAV